MTRSLYNHLKDEKIPVSNHESDLYFPVTPQSTKILQEYLIQETNATTFRDQITARLMYDVPFAYEPYWEQIHEKINHKPIQKP